MEITKATETPATVLPELRRWMEDVDLTHAELADIAGCSRPVITRTLQGKLPLKADRAARIAAVSGIPIDRLVTDRETARILKLWGKRSNRHGRTSK